MTRILAVLFATAVTAATTAAAGAAELARFDFEKDTIGQAPALAGRATLVVGGDRTALVAEKIDGFTGKALRLTRPVGEANYQPGLNIPVGALSGGTTTLVAMVKIESFKPGPKFANAEAILSVRAIGRDGRLFYQFRCIVDGDATGGTLSSMDRNVGEWMIGTAFPLAITLDLAAGTATVKANGAELIKDQKLDFPAPMVQWQICDGSALGGQDGAVTFALDNLGVTSAP